MLYGGVCAFLEEGGILGLELLLSPPIRAPTASTQNLKTTFCSP